MSSFVRNSFYSVANKLINVVLTFATLILVARVLEPSGQGKYSLLTQFTRTFFYFFALGFPASFVFFYGRKITDRLSLVKTYFYIYLFLAVVASIAGLGFTYFGDDEFFQGITLTTSFLAVIGISLWFLNSYLTAIFSGMENFRQLNLNTVTQPLFLFLAVLYFYTTGILSLRDAIVAFLFSHLFSAAFNFYFLYKKKFFHGFGDAKFDIGVFKHSKKYALKTYVSTISEFLIYRIDVYIIAYFLPKASLGLYVVAVNLVERIWMLSESVSKVLFAKLVNVTDENEKNFFSIFTLQGTFLVSLGSSFGLLIFTKIFIEIFFGEDYADSVLFVYLLLPGVALQSTALMIKQILGARGYPGTNALTSMYCLVLNIILNLITVPLIGIKGAAITSSVTYIAYFFVQAHSLNMKFGIKMRDYIIIHPKRIKELYYRLRTGDKSPSV